MSKSSRPSFKLRPLSAAVIAVLGAQAMGARAQDDVAAPGASVLPEVQVRGEGEEEGYAAGVTEIGKTLAPLRDVPQSVTVINRAVMDAQAATSLKDALRNVPGITISTGEGGNIGDNVNIRGFSARTDLFLDGFRDHGHYARETFFLERVEVLKGPSSMLFGRGSTGGVINQVSKQAHTQDASEITLGLGTYGLARTTVDVNRQMSDTSAFRISALAHTNESTRDVVEGERYGIAPSLRFGIGTPTEVSIYGLLQRSEEIPDYGIPLPQGAFGGTKENPVRPVDVDIDNFYGFTDDFFDQDVNVLTLRVDHRFSSSLSLRNQTQYNASDVHAAPTAFANTNPVARTVDQRRREREQENRALFNQTDLISRFSTGDVRHTLIAGLEIGRDEYRQQQYTWTIPTQDLDNPLYGPMPAGAVRTQNPTRVDNEADTVAAYVNDTIELTPRWKLIGGLRRDRFSADAVTITNATGARSVISRTDEKTSVRAGAIYQPDERQSYYVSYGTSFNPSAEALTIRAGNEDVPPEENRSYEIGAKWDFAGGRLAVTTAVFRVEKDNARTEDALGNTVLGGNTRADGFEVSASGQLAPNFQVFAGYTYLDGEIVELFDNGVSLNGNALANAPEHSASLWSVYSFTPAWEAGGGVVYASERFLNNTNTALVDGYTRYDATVAYKQKNYDLRLNLLNVTDEEYFEVGNASRSVPALGRAAVLTLTYRP